MAETVEGEPDPDYDFELRSGRLPATVFQPDRMSGGPSWQGRGLGQARLLGGRFVDVSHPDTHHELNVALGGWLALYGLRGFDRGLLMTQDRRITRQVAAHVHAVTTSERARDGGLDAIGISYECRFMKATCYAVWSDAMRVLEEGDVSPVTASHPDLRQAAQLLHIDIGAQGQRR